MIKPLTIWTELSPDQIHALIAESIGYKCFRIEDYPHGSAWSKLGYDDGDCEVFNGWHELPHYTVDLNASAEFERSLTKEEASVYEVYLRERVCGKSGFWYTPSMGEVFQVATATSPQRVEAYLLTKKLWNQ